MPELTCDRCHCQHRVWAASSPLWNATIRGGCIDGEEEHAYLCANCFMALAEDRGVASLFRLSAEIIAPTVQSVTPSGRVWNDQQFMWEKPQ